MSFSISAQDTPTTSNGLWQLAKTFGHYVITSIDAGQILIVGKFIGKIYEKNLESVNLAAAPILAKFQTGVFYRLMNSTVNGSSLV
jgi:hypothetical protein